MPFVSWLLDAVLAVLLVLLEWDIDAAGTVCLLISLLGTESASLRRTELELVEELDVDVTTFTSLLADVELEVFREVLLLLLLDAVVVEATATFFGGRAARFCSAWANWFREVPDLLRSGRSGTTGVGVAVDSLSLIDTV